MFCSLVEKELFLVTGSEVAAKLAETLGSFRVVLRDEIKSGYFYRESDRRVEIGEQSHELMVTGDGEESRMRKVVFSGEMPARKRLFYMSEILTEEIVGKMELESLEKSRLTQWRLKYKIGEYLESIDRLRSFI